MKELVRKDILLQWRQGFWLVYFVVSIIYIMILLNIPEENRMVVSLVMILSDTTMLGVIFIGALVLLEKQQSVIHSLFITPLEPSRYIWSKTISLSTIAITMSILIYLPVWHLSAYTILLLFNTAFTAAIFVLIGLGMAARTETINQYFGRLMMFSFLIILPVFPYLILDRHPAFLLLPYIASLDIMLGVIHPLPLWRIATDSILLLMWGYVAYRYSINQITKFLVYA